MPEDLLAIGRRHATDKVDDHHYLTHYERHLSHLRDKSFTLLEIGIGGYQEDGTGGSSLRMWRDYFPRARVLGLDLFDKSFVDDDRIRTFQGSQDDPAVLRRIIREEGRPTVVIDDGSHKPIHLRATFKLLFPELVDDGVYALEDLQTSYWPESGGRRWRHAPRTSMSLVKDLVDGLNHEEMIDRRPRYTDAHVTGVHCYHNLVFVQKGNNVEGSNRERVNYERFGDRPADWTLRKRQFRRWALQSAGDAKAAGLVAFERLQGR